jgi:ankyrin repeat protein
LAVVQFLVASGADYNTNGINGWTPLQSAAGNGHLAVFEFLIDTGADINRQESNYGWTPFHSAAVNGHLAVVEFFIKKGADINTKGNNGWTPLQSASGHGHQALVELINRRGAEVKSRNTLNGLKVSFDTLHLNMYAKLSLNDPDDISGLQTLQHGEQGTVQCAILSKDVFGKLKSDKPFEARWILKALEFSKLPNRLIASQNFKLIELQWQLACEKTARNTVTFMLLSCGPLIRNFWCEFVL